MRMKKTKRWNITGTSKRWENRSPSPRLLGFNKDEGTVLSACEGTPKCRTLHKGSAILGGWRYAVPLCIVGNFIRHIQFWIQGRLSKGNLPKVDSIQVCNKLSWIIGNCRSFAKMMCRMFQWWINHQWGINWRPSRIWCKKNSSTTRGPQEGQKTIIQPKRSCGSHDGFPAKGSSPGEIRPLFVPGFQFDEALSFTQSYEKKK